MPVLRYFLIIVCGTFPQPWLWFITFLQAALRAFGSVAWIILSPSLLEAATDIEWCLEATYGEFMDKVNHRVLKAPIASYRAFSSTFDLSTTEDTPLYTPRRGRHSH